MIKTAVAVLVSGVAVAASSAAPSMAQSMCPPEVASAKALLSRSRDDLLAGRSQDVQSPRSQSALASRSQDVQSPRSQDVQSPRSQDVQSPRSQDVQSPRGPDVRSPRGAASSTDQPNPSKKAVASELVREAEVACTQGNMTIATEKALAAIDLLR
jgi:hypothetical protein